MRIFRLDRLSLFWMAFCWLIPVQAFAQDRIELKINEVHFSGTNYTIVSIQVDPSAKAPQVYKNRIERLMSLQSETDKEIVVRSLLTRTQNFIAMNYVQRGRTEENGDANDYARGTAFKYPDPLGYDRLLQDEGLARPKTKIDDFLSRKSSTTIIFKGDPLSGSIVGTVKIVQSDYARANKDFSSSIPKQVFQRLSERFSKNAKLEFEVENLSIDRTKIDFFPFLLSEVVNSGVIADGLERERGVVKFNALPGPSLLYLGMGFKKYFSHEGVDYFSVDAVDLKPALESFFEISSEAELLNRPSLLGIDERTARSIKMFYQIQNQKTKFSPQPGEIKKINTQYWLSQVGCSFLMR